MRSLEEQAISVELLRRTMLCEENDQDGMIAEQYPESKGKVHVQFIVQRKGGIFSSQAEVIIECELEGINGIRQL